MTQKSHRPASAPIPGRPSTPTPPNPQTPPAEPIEVLGRHKNTGQMDHKGAREVSLPTGRRGQATRSASASRQRPRAGPGQRGTLIARNVEMGDVVQPGKVLMTLSPLSRMQLVMAIDEKNLALPALGPAARVRATPTGASAGAAAPQ